MKKYILLTIISLLIFQYNTVGQISLVGTYDNAVYVANIEDVGYKYYGINFETNQCEIYNIDHTLWKVIDIAPPENSYIDEIAYLSSKLFNNDSNIELLVVFTEYIQTSDTSGYYFYTTKVINENGVTFLDVPGGGYSNIYKIDESEANLLVYIYDFSAIPLDVSTNVYSIPWLPSSVNKINSGIVLKDAFPNPAHSFITVPYELQQTSVNAKIVVFNEIGVEVFRSSLIPNENIFRLNTAQFSKGVYFYNIESDGKKSSARKIIVQ